MRRSLLAFVSVLGAACSPPIGVQRAAIIGGTPDTGDPAVVLLISYPPDESTDYTCTASIISPTVLLTAAHCVDATNHPSYVFGMFPGDDASAYANASQFAAVLLPVQEVHAHPSYDPSSPFTADIGIVVLASPVSTTPLPIDRTALSSSLAGTAARLVGYGQTTYGVFNATKYQTSTTVQSVPGDDTVVVGDTDHHSCVGDSGGPALVTFGGTETIIGVDSYAATGCTEPSHYRRVDEYLPFIDTYVPLPPADFGVDAAIAVDAASAPVDGVFADAAVVDASMHGASSSGCTLAPHAGATPMFLLLLLALLLTVGRCGSTKRCSTDR